VITVTQNFEQNSENATIANYPLVALNVAITLKKSVMLAVKIADLDVRAPFNRFRSDSDSDLIFSPFNYEKSPL
jgi:hypothetical protein